MKATITNLNPVTVEWPVKPKTKEINNKYGFGSEKAYQIWKRANRLWQSIRQEAEVKNWYYGRDENYQEYYTVGIGLNYFKVSLGMTVEFEPETKMITKIL